MRFQYFSGVWCDFGKVGVFEGFCVKFMGFGKEFYVFVNTRFSSGLVFLVIAVL